MTGNNCDFSSQLRQLQLQYSIFTDLQTPNNKRVKSQWVNRPSRSPLRVNLRPQGDSSYLSVRWTTPSTFQQQSRRPALKIEVIKRTVTACVPVMAQQSGQIPDVEVAAAQRNHGEVPQQPAVPIQAEQAVANEPAPNNVSFSCKILSLFCCFVFQKLHV